MLLLEHGKRYEFDWCGFPAQIDFGTGDAEFTGVGKTNFVVPDTIKSFRPEAHSIDSVIITVAGSCNLACSYCSVDSGLFKSPRKTSVPDGTSVIQSTISLLKSCTGTPAVSFMGGEPLLNKPLIKEIIAGVSEHFSGDVAFSMPTNLTLLDRKTIDFLAEHNVHLLASIDGPPQIHDRNRPQRGGRSSFAQANRGLNLLFEADYPSLTARPTITDVREMLEVYLYLSGLGFEGVLFGMDFVETDARYDRSVVQSQFKSIIDYIATYEGSREPARFVLLAPLIETFLSASSRTAFEFVHCGAGVTSMNIGIDGALYPCHNYALEGVSADRIVGDLVAGLDPMRLSSFVDHSVAVRGGCKDCALSPFCPGGCVFLEETTDSYWGRGTCGVRHLPFLELVEASLYAMAKHLVPAPARFARRFAPKLYRDLKRSTQRVIASY